VFKVTPGGSFSLLATFTDAATEDYPVGGLVQGLDGKFYGTTLNGGTNGSLFVLSGTTVTHLHSFTASSGGIHPNSNLILATDGNIYGANSSNVFRLRFADPITQNATGISLTGATLNGVANPNGVSTSVYFLTGTSPTLAGASSTSSTSIGSGSAVVAVGIPVTGLSASNTYYYRVVAASVSGTNYGDILSFTTANAPIENWKALQFGANAGNPAISGDTVVSNKAGITNLMAYALGLSASSAAVSGLPVAGTVAYSGSNYLKLVFPQNSSATDIVYTVEGTTNLSGSNWSAVSTCVNGSWSPWMNGVVTQVSGTTTVRDSAPITSGTRRFLRLKVTH
jgi:hypothetical protein